MKKDVAVDYAVKNTLFLYIGNLVIEVVNLFISIYIIRRLEVSTFGLYNFILGSMLFIQILTISSISTIINRFIPEFVEKSKFKLYHKLFVAVLIFVTVSLAVLSAGIFVFSEGIGKFFKLGEFSQYSNQIIFYMISYIFMLLARSYTSSSLLQRVTAVINVITSVIRISVYIVFWKNIDLSKILIIEASVNTLNGIAQLLLIYGYILKNIKKDSSEKILKLKERLIRYGVLSFFNEVGAGMINKASSYYVISAMSNTYLLGQYSFAYKINDMFMKVFPIDQISNVLKPIFFRKFVNKPDDMTILNDMYLFLYKFLFWILAFFCFYFLSVSDIIVISVFDPKYKDSITITNIIFMFTLFNAFQLPLSYVVLSLEKLEINLYSKVFFIYNIIGSIFAMKWIGLIGVAIVLGSSILFKNLFILIGLRKYVKLSFPFSSIIRSTLTASVVFIVCYLSKSIFEINPYIYLILSFIVSAFIYYFLSKLSSPFEEKEKVVINMILDKMKLGFIHI